MFKPVLSFAAFLIVLGLVGLRSYELPLSFFVLFFLPALFVFHFWQARQRAFFYAAAGLTGLAWLVFWAADRSLEAFCFGPGACAFVALLSAYDRRWRRRLESEQAVAESMRKEYEALHTKQASRLVNLHHLEKQVASLMNLFEISRDFSESLTVETMVELLHKKVLPELPFEAMTVMIFERGVEGDSSPAQLYKVTPEGVGESAEMISKEELSRLREVFMSKQMQKTDRKWVFPLLAEGAARAALCVEGAQEEDLAKFEVLAAHLVLQTKKSRLYERVKELSILDGLTGLYVRRHFLERFEDELRRSIKFERPLSVLMLDIDHFKRYNDELGHLVGDATLKEVAHLLRENLRKVDIVARYGGEEFIVVIPEAQRENTQEVAERIRSGIARHRFNVFDEVTQVTVSIGISHFPADVAEQYRKNYHADALFELIQHADQALYRAKEEGRNRVVFYREP